MSQFDTNLHPYISLDGMCCANDYVLSKIYQTPLELSLNKEWLKHS